MSAEPRAQLQLVRPVIADIQPYVPAETEEVLAQKSGLPVSRLVKLDANENLYGPSPRVSRWLAGLAELAESAGASVPAESDSLTFTEPNLTLRAGGVPERGWVTLIIDLQQEFQAPSERRRGGRSTLTLIITSAELRRAADEWGREIARYPAESS